MSTPSELVQLLRVAAADGHPDPRDVELAKTGEQWLLRNGWHHHYRMGLASDTLAVSADVEDEALILRRKVNGFWEAEGTRYPVDSFRAGLNMLVVLGVLPERFSTFGRDALRDYLGVCESAADATYIDALCADGAEHQRLLARAQAFRDAAAAGRRLYPLKVPA